MRIDDLALAEAFGFDGLAHLLARQLLGVGGDGIFEVEDQRVRRKPRAFSSARAFEPGM